MSKKIHTWLLPMVLMLFILEIATLPLVISLTYSGRSESPDRVITYSENQLVWDSSAAIDDSGAAELSLFSSYYQNVQADEDVNILAPGTEGDNIIRLENDSPRSICYTAVVYQIQTSATLDIATTLDGSGFADADDYYLPDAVGEEAVIRAVDGIVESGRVQDFDINWEWLFEGDGQKDINDTFLGDKAASGDPDDVVIGFYIVVEDDGDPVIPEPPETGDTGLVELYIILICVSGVALVLLFLYHRRDKRSNKNEAA